MATTPPDGLPTTFCCEDLRRELFKNSDCSQHGWDCPDRVITCNPKSHQYGIRHPDANSYYRINNCPWCGNTLKVIEPTSPVSTRNMTRVGTYKIEEVLPFAVPDKRDRGHIRDYDGHRVKMHSLRYQCFIQSGTACVTCGLKGEYFALERFNHQKQATPSFHFNLYAKKDGVEILFTKDHIIPVCKGGKDYVQNFQTMCEPCNLFKGGTLPESRGSL